MIMAINANVAFQTIDVTSITSLKSTTPTSKAKIAPPQADQPIESPFGCHITNVRVSRKMIDAKITDTICYKPSIIHTKCEVLVLVIPVCDNLDLEGVEVSFEQMNSPHYFC